MVYVKIGELLIIFGEILFLLGAIGLLSGVLVMDQIPLLAAPALVLVGVGAGMKHKGDGR